MISVIWKTGTGTGTENVCVDLSISYSSNQPHALEDQILHMHYEISKSNQLEAWV